MVEDLLTKVKDTYIGKNLIFRDLKIWISLIEQVLVLEKELIQIKKDSDYTSEQEIEFYNAITKKKKIESTHIGKFSTSESLEIWVNKINKVVSLWKRLFYSNKEASFTSPQFREFYNSIRGIPKNYIGKGKLKELQNTFVGKQFSLEELQNSVQIIKDMEIKEKELMVENKDSGYTSLQVKEFLWASQNDKNSVFTSKQFNEFYQIARKDDF